jgi:hypothetical protein
MDKKNLKTKKVAGVDLNAECFLYAPDAENTSSWLFPVLVRGEEAKTRNLIVMHLHNFNVRTAALPDALRQKLWERLVGAEKCIDVHIERDILKKTIDTGASGR